MSLENELQNELQVVCDQLSAQMREKNGSPERGNVFPASTKIAFNKSYALMLNPNDTWSAVEYNMSAHALNNLERDQVLQYYALIIEREEIEEAQDEERRNSLLTSLISALQGLVKDK